MTRRRDGGGLRWSVRVFHHPAAATRRLAVVAALVGAAGVARPSPAGATSSILGTLPGSQDGCVALQGASPVLTTAVTPNGTPFLYLDTAMTGASEVETALSAATAAGITAAVGLSPADVGWIPGGFGGSRDAATIATDASSSEPVGDGASGGLGAPVVRAAIRSGHWVVVANAGIPGGLPTALDAFEAATGSRPLFVTDAVAEAEAARDSRRRSTLGGLRGAPRPPEGGVLGMANSGDLADDESIFGVVTRGAGGSDAGGVAAAPAGGLGEEGEVGAADAAAAAVAAAACAAHVFVLPAAVVAMREGPGAPGAAGLEGLLSGEQLHGAWDAAGCDVVGGGDAAAALCGHLRRAYAAARGGEELAKFPPPSGAFPSMGDSRDGGTSGDGDGGRAIGGDESGGGVGLAPARRRRVEAAYARVRAAATRRAPVREALGVLLSVPAAVIGESSAEEAALRDLGGGAGLSLGVMDRLLRGGGVDSQGGTGGWLGLFRLVAGLVGLWLVLGGALGLWDAWGRGTGGLGRRHTRGVDPLGGGLLPVGSRKPPPRGGANGGVVAAVLSQFAETGKSM
ncbi:hypothetical protein MMPV_007094 [Pyropia vietnamensis]